MKLPWSKVEPGMTVELKGKPWRVEIIDKGGKRATLTVTSSLGTYTSEVKLKDEVTIHRPKEKALRDERGAQQRWATDAEAAEVEPKKAAAEGSPWETQLDRVERDLSTILGAKLVGESLDTGAGYYVPPTDVSTIKAHLLVFHAGADLTRPEGELLEWHGAQHRDPAARNTFTLPHWHTEKRPS